MPGPDPFPMPYDPSPSPTPGPDPLPLDASSKRAASRVQPLQFRRHAFARRAR